MFKVTTYCDWDLKLDLELEKKVELYIDNQWKHESQNGDSIKVLLVCEPRSIMPGMRKVARRNRYKFDFILTHDEQILNDCKNAVLFEFGSSWISEGYSFPQKSFSVSTVVGKKKITQGHKLRKTLWKRKDRISVPEKFFLSRFSGDTSDIYPVLQDSKEPLFDSQFHIAIENDRLKYYFTEKLIDCFRTKTVPIYWGCPNIADYFNTGGMIIVNNVNEIISACNNLNENTYSNMEWAIEDNYIRSGRYKDFTIRVGQKLLELCGS